MWPIRHICLGKTQVSGFAIFTMQLKKMVVPSQLVMSISHLQHLCDPHRSATPSLSNSLTASLGICI